jgi:hypothetical protein
MLATWHYIQEVYAVRPHSGVTLADHRHSGETSADHRHMPINSVTICEYVYNLTYARGYINYDIEDTLR